MAIPDDETGRPEAPSALLEAVDGGDEEREGETPALVVAILRDGDKRRARTT